MNETNENKISVAQGKVSQSGYEDTICTFIKADENRSDSFKDKPLYILDDINISDNMYAVTPNVLEALNRTPRRTIGIMNKNGDLLLPIINFGIVKINDKYLAVKTSNNIESDNNAIKQEETTVNEKIKNKILEVDPNVRFICDNYYEVYDIYEIKNDTLTRVYENASYIGINGEVIYANTKDINEETQIINKNIDDPNVKMPVDALADVNNISFDSLDVNEDLQEVKEGAPELTTEKSESNNFNINEIESDLAEINNDIIMQQDEKNADFNSNEEGKVEEKIVEVEKPEIEKEIKPSFEYYKVKEEKSDDDINEMVSAVKAKLINNKEEITRLQDEMVEKDTSIKNMRTEIENRDEEIMRLHKLLEEKDTDLREMEQSNHEKDLSIKDMKRELEDKDSKIESLNNKNEKYQETIGTIRSEFSKLLDDNTEKKYYKAA